MSRLTMVVVVILVAACSQGPSGSGLPSTLATPLVTPASSITPPVSPSGAPSATPTPSGPSATGAACSEGAPRSAGLPARSIATITVDALNVRVAPCTSAGLLEGPGVTNPLAKGSRVLILDGAIVADGYRWYAVGLDGEGGVDGPPVGWVAAGATSDGWLRATELPCPAAGLAEIAGLGAIERLACFGTRAVSFTAHQAAEPPDAGFGGACGPLPGQPGWLVCDNINYNLVNADGGPLGRGVATLLLHFDPATGIEPLDLAPVGSTGPSFQIRGHFGDAAASACPVDATPGSRAYLGPWLSCATKLVVEDLQPAP